ncbi:MAG: zinc ribbon domain-containing protein [Phycisphaerales bacterium]|nr:zinc ribbon domain-containing protein [Phycisphaerales bacterium]
MEPIDPWGMSRAMPVYEYVCTSCEYEFEMFVRSMADRDEARCPKCHGVKVQRKLSVFAARSGAAKSSEFSGGGACGRCGDPNGPCSI